MILQKMQLAAILLVLCWAIGEVVYSKFTLNECLLRAERLRGVAKKSLTRSDTGHSLGLDIRPSLAHNDDTIFPETSTVPRPHSKSTS